MKQQLKYLRQGFLLAFSLGINIIFNNLSFAESSTSQRANVIWDGGSGGSDNPNFPLRGQTDSEKIELKQSVIQESKKNQIASSIEKKCQAKKPIDHINTATNGVKPQ